MRALFCMLLFTLSTGCASFKARIETARKAQVGRETEARADTGCVRSGVAGCPSPRTQIRRFEVSPKDAVDKLRRVGTMLIFVPNRVGVLTFTLEMLVEGELQRVTKTLEVVTKR